MSYMVTVVNTILKSVTSQDFPSGYSSANDIYNNRKSKLILGDVLTIHCNGQIVREYKCTKIEIGDFKRNLIGLKIDFGFHASDIYIKVTGDNKKIVIAYELYRQNVTVFYDCDGVLCYEIPFEYNSTNHHFL